jgi:hypothetical protein
MISFDFGESDPIGVKTMRLLNQYGEVNATGLTLKKIFQNDRIYIEGVLNAEVKYQDLYIAIKLKTGEHRRNHWCLSLESATARISSIHSPRKVDEIYRSAI